MAEDIQLANAINNNITEMLSTGWEGKGTGQKATIHSLYVHFA